MGKKPMNCGLSPIMRNIMLVKVVFSSTLGFSLFLEAH